MWIYTSLVLLDNFKLFSHIYYQFIFQSSLYKNFCFIHILSNYPQPKQLLVKYILFFVIIMDTKQCFIVPHCSSICIYLITWSWASFHNFLVLFCFFFRATPAHVAVPFFCLITFLFLVHLFKRISIF